MAVAFIQEFAISDRGTANYDAVNERLTKNQPAPEGLLIHFAGFDDEDGVFRVVNVWETREQGQAYLDEQVMPAVHAVLGDVEWPRRRGRGSTNSTTSLASSCAATDREAPPRPLLGDDTKRLADCERQGPVAQGKREGAPKGPFVECGAVELTRRPGRGRYERRPCRS